VWNLESCLSVIPKLKRLGILEIILSGGEPLILKWLEPLIDVLISEGFKVDICTNATLIDSERAEKLSKCLSEISISIDSPDAETHDKIRGVSGAWEAAKTGCRLLQSHGMTVHVTSMVDDRSFNNIEPMVKYAVSIGIKSLAFIGRMDTKPEKSPWLSLDKQQQFLNDCINSCRSKYPEIQINTKRLLRPILFPACGGGKSIFGLNAEGFLLPCILFSGYSQFSTPLKSWNGNYDFSKLPKPCTKNCSKSENCYGGCLGSHYLKIKEIGPDLLCLKEDV
jgi:MoaA/NifB/PqqE/SkfB family radical SAM enzyme